MEVWKQRNAVEVRFPARRKPLLVLVLFAFRRASSHATLQTSELLELLNVDYIRRALRQFALVDVVHLALLSSW